MARVYTARLIHGFGDRLTHRYVVQPLHRVVVRNALARAGVAGDKYWLLLGGAVVWYWASPGAAGTNAFETRVVAYAGEYLEVYTEGQQIDVWISGYIFDDAAAAGQLPVVEEEIPGERPELYPP